MKLSRKLIPAFIMLLVSAVLMSTASYAWFAMNTTVTVDGLNVTAKADDEIFLEIKNELGNWDVAYEKEADAVALLPAANKFVASGENRTPVANLYKGANWYYKIGSDVESSDGGETEYPITDALLGNYVAVATYAIRVNPNMQTKAFDLYVSSITIDEGADMDGVCVIIAGANGWQEFKASSDGTIDFDAQNILSNEVTTTEQTITVYYYIDGNNEKVTTNNRQLLGGAIEFTLSAHSEDQNPSVGG
jgi:hypothetical protein